MFGAKPTYGDGVTHTVILFYSVGAGKDAAEMRLVIRPGEALEAEVATEDRLGATSWRPSKGVGRDLIEKILALAVMKSQMTPLQRIQQPNALHPDGVVWNSGECHIQLGTVKL